MTAIVRFRTVAASARRLWGAVITVVVAVGSFVVSGSVARADQTVYFDGAGNAPHIGLIGDSTLTGVRWYADYGALEQFNFVLSAESCRRTIEQSCISREGYRSANVITAMRTLDGELGEVLVVMSGYNDPVWTIDEAIAGVVDEARAQGVGHVVWLSLRTNDDVDYSDPQKQSSINTFRQYNEQLFAAAEASDGYLQVADWATYSNGASGWFEADGVHLTARGVDAVTTFIAGTADRVLAGENVSPAAAPWTVLVPGAEGEIVAAAQEALIAASIEIPGGADGVYGNDTMAAVAEFQRRNDALQLTGAVDMDTARSLGVLPDPEVADETATTAPPATAVAATTVPVPAPAAAVGESPEPIDSDDAQQMMGMPRWLLVAASVVVVLAGAVVGRRRYVAVQRAARRWARVHPATSPRRSVADLRRAGEFPTATDPPGRIYDHQLEQPTVEAAEAASPSTV
ncbi:MAG: peptidoglycan-binding protein [Acidimicrobiia bacterium]|nr:peptidoglycan-binding protein [Acidimicrobiia bacterium]